jgi:ADP-heptose:LPS heptosyltransferase
MHKGDYYCNLLQSAGVRINNNQPQFNLTAEELKEVRNLPEYQDARKKFSHIIVLNPAANWQLKQWPVSYFIDFARMMLEANCAVFLVGSVAYRELITKIKEAVPQSYDLSGRTTLRQLAAVLASSDLVVSADSGPAHLAGALEVPTIVIFGPTLPQLSAPRSQAVVVIKDRVDCQLPCYNLKCQDNTCMKKIRPELVVERAKEILLKND